MPITGPASYPQTTVEFMAHWTSVDAAVGAGNEVVLRPGMGLADLVGLYDGLMEARAGVERERNGWEGERAVLMEMKVAALARLNQFTGRMRSMTSSPVWLNRLPKAFSVDAGMGMVLPRLDEVADVWERYESAEAAFTLMGGQTRAAFGAALAALKAQYAVYGSARIGLGLQRWLRTELEVKIHEVLKAYRLRIASEFPEGSALLETMPRLSPLPGSTPDAVVLDGSWNTGTEQVDLAWSEVTDESVQSLQIRASIGPEFEDSDAAVLGTFAPDDPRTFSTSYGFTTPGTAVSFKIYSMTAEGNERGSEAVAVTKV